MMCAQCGLDRPAERFEPRRRTCRDCNNAAARARGRRPYSTERQRWFDYRMSSESFDAMVEQQGGLCAVCRRPPEKLVVDHDHRTGLVRGLLCGPCNRALGHLQDQPGLCLSAAEYLRESTET
ncbi:MAG: endonuclease VII domain-containing protein [Acidimicrobiales bacterium]